MDRRPKRHVDFLFAVVLAVACVLLIRIFFFAH